MWIIALLPLLMILLGAGLLLGGSDERKRIAHAPIGTCAGIPAAREVKLLGRAVADSELTSPLGKVQCVFYRLVFLQYERKIYQRSRELEEVHRMQQSAPGFSIADHTGKIEIDATGADLRAEKGHAGSSGLLGDNAVDAVVAQHLPPGLGDERTTVYELVIPVGAPLLVIGEAVVTPARSHLGGSRLLLSLLPEKALVKRDKGDLAGAALVLGGAVIGGLMIFAAFRS